MPFLDLHVQLCLHLFMNTHQLKTFFLSVKILSKISKVIAVGINFYL